MMTRMRGVTLNEHLPDGAQRLAAAVKARREALGLSQGQLQTLGGPSHDRVYAIENATRDNYDRSTLNKIERALKLQPGSIQQLLEGGAFSPMPGTEHGHNEPQTPEPVREAQPTPEESELESLHLFMKTLGRRYGASVISRVAAQVYSELAEEEARHGSSKS